LYGLLLSRERIHTRKITRLGSRIAFKFGQANRRFLEQEEKGTDGLVQGKGFLMRPCRDGMDVHSESECRNAVSIRANRRGEGALTSTLKLLLPILKKEKEDQKVTGKVTRRLQLRPLQSASVHFEFAPKSLFQKNSPKLSKSV
jgi:hypothetical protein